MKTARWIKGLTMAVSLLLGPLQATADPITIFAAASLQGPLDEVAAAWPGAATLSYAGSGTIARQISLGAPADVVMLASPEWMEWLADRGHLVGAPVNVTSNQLVLIGPPGATQFPSVDMENLRARLGDGRLAMGHHQAVPAGVYGAAWLRSISAWEDLRPRLAETENVRAALALVSRGEAPLGLVYASDAQADGTVEVLYSVPPDMHPPILYPAAAVTSQGAAFIDHLMAQRDRFATAGFKSLP
ncbi:molybdate ABC transporter substrate-binding protein [uncultured Tateyamaria sp.]|uniref:molybdate ABC transporter substrate-binding protein n=1 Tax=Tateyamaria sp. 1078 TaxID=3417464 RepID=UPI00262EECD1|nr:molybdate ABC transporter substrate-binding protein [uncultured Tateyamaria sp.]